MSRVSNLSVAIITICLLLGPALVVADSPSGTGPGDALAPSGEWTLLVKGEQHWYAFEYRGHLEMQQAQDGEDEEKGVWAGSNIQVLLDSEPNNGTTFSVWTPENARLWALGEEVEPVGRGGQDKYSAADLSWSGSFQEPGTYYVVVEHAGQGPNTVYYTLEIQSPDVSFSTPAATPAKPAETAAGAGEPTPAAVAKEPAAVEAKAPAGTGPDNALAASDEWMATASGQVHWYAFDYQGHTPVKISLDAEPNGVVTFGVWTEDQARRWALGEEIEPVGRGTKNENEPGDLFWAGSLGNPGRYYVVVEHQGTEIGSFKLNISGEDISP